MNTTTATYTVTIIFRRRNAADQLFYCQTIAEAQAKIAHVNSNEAGVESFIF